MEAIGLLLNITPMFIEFLKANPEPLYAIQAVKTANAKEMMSEFYRDILFEVSMLKMTLANLINELPISDELKQKLTDESSLDPAVWKMPPDELQSALARRLNPCYDPFTQSMEKILKILAKLVDDKSLPLLLSEDQIRVCTGTPYAKLETIFDTKLTLSKKMKFGWKKDKREKMLRGLGKYNQRLDQMLKKTSEAGTGYIPPARRVSSSFTPHLGLRQKMSDLRRAIGKSWCKCMSTCTSKHELRCGLSKTWKPDDQVRLDVIMNLSKDTMQWHWGESKIDIHLKDSPSLKAVDSSPVGRGHRRSSSSFTGTTLAESPINSSPGGFSSTTPRNSLTRTVTIDDEKQEERQNSRRLSESQNSRIFVHDICKTLQNGQRLKRAPQLIFHEDNLWHNAKTTDSEVPVSHPGVPLESYLQAGKMTMKDRKILQVLLAQSVLFFPWAGQDLNKNSISFHYDLDKPFANFLPDHGDDPTEELADMLEDEPPEFQIYNNETLAALATTLLEIELQMPIEELQTEEDLGDSDSSKFTANFWTTTRALGEHRDNMYKGSYDAIDACLRCDFEEEAATLEDPNFLQQVYERIVAPLEQELEKGFNIQMPYLGAPDPKVESKAPTVKVTMRGGLKSAMKKSVKISEGPQLEILEEGEVTKKLVRTMTIAPAALETRIAPV